MELIDVLHMVGQQGQQAAQPTDMVIGTVESVNPLTVRTNIQSAPLQESVLLLTSAVVERKIPILQHIHHIDTLSHQHANSVVALTGSYPTLPSLYSEGAGADQTQDIICYEHGQPLPIEDGFIILNRALEVGDKVIMMKVQRGQRYVILSRVFEFQSGGDG